MRRLEHPSGKFWSIERGGALVTVRWGALGTPGQSVTRELADHLAAEARVESEIARQLKLGYLEVVPVPTRVLVAEDRWDRRLENQTQYLELSRIGSVVISKRGWLHDNAEVATQRFECGDVHRAEATVSQLLHEANLEKFRVPGFFAAEDDSEDDVVEADIEPPAPRNPTLEAACREAPDDPATWSVYADWLLEHGDPRGEIAAMFQRDPKSWKSKDLVRKHRVALFRSDELGRCCTVTTWRHGFPVAITITHPEGMKPSLAEKTRLMLARPFLQFVEDVRFGVPSSQAEDGEDANPTDSDWGTTMAAVTSSPIASSMRALRFEDCEGGTQLGWAAFGDFSEAWAKLPALEELVINSRDGGELGTIVLPKLRRFVRISGGLRADEIRSICEATWPALEHLEVWFGTADQGAQGSVLAIEKLLAGRGTPQLRHLGLVNCEFSDDLVLALVGSPVLARLRALDLSRSTLDSATGLLAHASAFAHLAAIDLRRNFLTPAMCAAIRGVLPNADVSDQRSGQDRYAEVGE